MGPIKENALDDATRDTPHQLFPGLPPQLATIPIIEEEVQLIQKLNDLGELPVGSAAIGIEKRGFPAARERAPPGFPKRSLVNEAPAGRFDISAPSPSELSKER